MQAMAKKKNILDMSYLEAKNFFLKNESYTNAELPPYFNFNDLLKAVDKELEGKELAEFFGQVRPSDLDDVNYTLFYSKDGKYGWRPIELIHPLIYVSLVNEMTKETNWNFIVERIKTFQKVKNIVCSSLPIESDYKSRDKASQIFNWWSENEQKSIELGLEYSYIVHTDISNCYGSLYTHSIAWALHDKKEAKSKEFKKCKSNLGNVIDRHIQNMQHGQTNGIPQGSILMDLIAEIVLGYCDTLLAEKLKSSEVGSYKILRYRDDFRIFTKSPTDSEIILKALTEVLIPFGLKLNTSKTFSSDDVIVSSIKKDKYSWILKNLNKKEPLRYLLGIYQHSLDFPNSGTITKELTKYFKSMEIRSDGLMPLISIATEIAFKNSKTHPVVAGILSKMLVKIESMEKRNDIISKILLKFQTKPNIESVEIWLQRICLGMGIERDFHGRLCETVSKKKVKLWESSWISNKKLRSIIETSQIVSEEKIEGLNEVINIEEVDIFAQLYY